MTDGRYPPLVWGIVVVLFVLVLWVVVSVFALLWRVVRDGDPPPALPLYDWKQDDGLLDVWARDEEGEVRAVFPTNWLYK